MEKQKEKEKECPFCQVPEETLKILKEKGKKNKLKEKPKNNGE